MGCCSPPGFIRVKVFLTFKKENISCKKKFLYNEKKGVLRKKMKKKKINAFLLTGIAGAIHGVV